MIFVHDIMMTALFRGKLAQNLQHLTLSCRLFLTFLTSSPYLEWPQGLVGWAGWFIFAGVLLYFLYRWRKYNGHWGSKQVLLLVLLALCVPLSCLFMGIKLPASLGLPSPDLPRDFPAPTILIFSAIPWMLAAGLLGLNAAAGLAFFAGLLQALWITHNPFTPLEICLLAILFAAAMQQNYRTRIYRGIHHPLMAALCLSVFYPLLSLATTPLASRGFLASRMDFALTQLGGLSLAMASALIIGGVFGEIIAVSLPQVWGGHAPLVVSPSERSLQARFLYSIAPLAFALLLILLAANWIVAGNTARRLLSNQMANAAKIAAEGVPVYLGTGQTLMSEITKDPDLLNGAPDKLSGLLESKFYDIPYFNQIYLLDRSGQSLEGFPQSDYRTEQAPIEEQALIQIALNGLPVPTYVPSPTGGNSSSDISFVAAVNNQAGVVERVLVGRSALSGNPFAQSILNSLGNFSVNEGRGYLIDENGRILYSSDGSSQGLNSLQSNSLTASKISDTTGPDGTRQLAYLQPAEGHPWSILITVPARYAQETALRIATPLLWVIIILAVASIIPLRLQVSSITSSLQALTVEAGKLAQGDLDQPLPVEGEDETGQLSRAFEKMRASLKSRLDELKLLLTVSQGVASSLEIADAVQPILEFALATGASASRVILEPSVVPGLDGQNGGLIHFTAGSAGDTYQYLDEQIISLTRNQDQIIMPNITRPRLFNFSPGVRRPELMIALALRHENTYYGALWVAYDKSHPFTEEESRFLSTLASQAALAAANARLFQTAEVGRQRLAAILASTPDPVLVTDQQDRLILANPAALQVLGLPAETDEELPLSKVIPHQELLDLLHEDGVDNQSVEITLPSGDIYLATASSVLADGQKVGRVCLLRNITHLKELDTMKSEFVSTVSHDLRNPLTLMRGYATMLEMVGELNEQQTGYVRKIVGSVEDMSRLVNSLLDLGRIESGVDLQLELLSVQELIERVTGQLQMQANQKHIELVTQIAPQIIPLVEADPALLQQALQNLIDNAIKIYSRERKSNRACLFKARPHVL